MQRRIEKKCEDHLSEFKNEIKNWIEINNINFSGNQTTSDFLKFVYDFNSIYLNKDDFVKRKRVKNQVAQNERCCACRANGDQCTRRKKPGINFCGTHEKGTPHGAINLIQENETSLLTKIEISIQDIQGINYCIDNDFNVYKTEDILSNKVNPTIIGNYTIDNDGNYSIKIS